MPRPSPAIRAVLYGWAGITHVLALFTVLAVLYFPVYLDSHARRLPGAGVSWPGPALALGAGLLYVVLRRPRVAARPSVSALATPVRAAIVVVVLWGALSLWSPSGRVLWDSGPDWAGSLYLVYWTAAGVAAYLLSAGRGLAYVTGCAQLIEAAQGRAPRPPQLVTGGLHRYSRHPSLMLLRLSVWVTPVLTIDRLVWALLVFTVTGWVARVEDQAAEAAFGARFAVHRSQVPRWFAVRQRGHRGGTDGA